MNPMNDIVTNMAADMKGIPILQQAQEESLTPTIVLTVYGMEQPAPFDALLALLHKSGKPNMAFLDPPYFECTSQLSREEREKTPDSFAWFRSSEENQKRTQMFWIARAMGCLLAMAQTLDPSFKLKKKEVQQRIKSLQPRGRKLTEEEATAYRTELERAKELFEKANPGFDSSILTRPDLPQTTVELEEGKHAHDPQGGAYMEGEFRPTHPKVLNPYIEVVRKDV